MFSFPVESAFGEVLWWDFAHASFYSPPTSLFPWILADKQTEGGLTEGMKYHQGFLVIVSLETGGSYHPPNRRHRPADPLPSWSMLKGRWIPSGPGRGRPRSLCWYRDQMSYLCHESERPCILRAVAISLPGPLSRERGPRTVHSEQPALFLGDGESGGRGWTLSLALPHYKCLWMFPFLWVKEGTKSGT